MLSVSRRLALVAATVMGVASAASVQKAGLVLPPEAAKDANHVKSMFTEAYSTYKKFAFGHDDLQPVSKSFSDGRNGWGASIVDGMTTMSIMGLDELFNEAVNFSSTIDFSKSKVGGTVSVFETSIRYVGGLLSAYRLSNSKHEILVEKAKEVADKMAFAWIKDNTIPYGELDFATNQPVIQNTTTAEAGTLTLEWFTLSQLTRNDTYRKLAEGSVRTIISLPDPRPGLAPQCINPSTSQFSCAYITWGDGTDSYFEYLLKYPILTGTTDPVFIDTWRLAVDSSIRYLKSTSTVGNHVYLADLDDNGNVRHVGSHLACYYGGNWLLGGKLLGNDTIVDVALDLVEACWNTYQSTATGIGPEIFAWTSSDGNFTDGNAPSPSELDFYERNGFYITDSEYILRPEVLESNFYAWRVTGDEKYLTRARSAMNSMNTFLKVNNAYAGTNDVNNSTTSFIDDTESFFFAEVMKYLFLTFDDPEHISLDKFVFNTEAHPFPYEPVSSTFGKNPLTFPDVTKSPKKSMAFVDSPTGSANPAHLKQMVPLVHSIAA